MTTLTHNSGRRCASTPRTGTRPGRLTRTTGWPCTLNFQGRYEEALTHAEQALDSYTVIGDQSGRALALNSCGWFHTVLGDQPRAISYASQALDLFRKLGNQDGAAGALDSLGYAEQQGGRFTEATRYYREAVELDREIGNRWGLAETLNHLGDSQHAAGHRAEARAAWEEAYVILEDLGHPDAARSAASSANSTRPTPANYARLAAAYRIKARCEFGPAVALRVARPFISPRSIGEMPVLPGMPQCSRVVRGARRPANSRQRRLGTRFVR